MKNLYENKLEKANEYLQELKKKGDIDFETALPAFISDLTKAVLQHWDYLKGDVECGRLLSPLETSGGECVYCEYFADSNENEFCFLCPIRNLTGSCGCYKTPYYPVRDLVVNYHDYVIIGKMPESEYRAELKKRVNEMYDWLKENLSHLIIREDANDSNPAD